MINAFMALNVNEVLLSITGGTEGCQRDSFHQGCHIQWLSLKINRLLNIAENIQGLL